jgi:hypothetical protein
MASWSEFAADEPRLAAAIRLLMQQYGPGLGYLATVRADGGPRVHPVSPVITEGGLYCFIVDSPKRRDLERDGRYALHSFPAERSDDEAYLTGHAIPVTDPVRTEYLARQFRARYGTTVPASSRCTTPPRGVPGCRSGGIPAPPTDARRCRSAAGRAPSPARPESV